MKATNVKVTYGQTYAIGMPSVVVKGCEGVFLNGKEVGGIWWMGALDSSTPYHPVVNKQALGRFATEKEAKDAVESYLGVDNIEPECDTNSIETNEGEKMVNVDMVNGIYKSKSGDFEGRVIRSGKGYTIETRDNSVGWNDIEFEGEVFDHSWVACEVLESFLNAN